MSDPTKSGGPPPPPPAHLLVSPEPGWTLVYHRPLGAGMGTFMSLTLREKGDFSTVRLTANLSPAQEIGFFRVVLPEPEVKRLRDLAHASDYLKYGHRGPMRPDTPTTSLYEGKQAATFTPDSPPPAPVLKVLEQLDAVALEITKHPFWVLRGEAKWSMSEVRRGEHLQATVRLSSVGTEIIKPHNPLGATSPTWVGLRLTIAKDKPRSDLDWEKDVKQVDLTPQDLLTVDGKLAKGQPPRVELPPGAELRFQLRRKLLLPEGRYTGSLILIGGPDPLGNTRVVEGHLTMDLGPITVRD